MATFSLEKQILDPWAKHSNKHGNNGGQNHSARPKTKWKETKIIENCSKEFALDYFKPYLSEKGYKVLNYDTGETIFNSGERY